MNKAIITNDFQLALKDYYYLINHNYPERGSLKMVGDRYRLSGDQRTILYRGITSDEKALKRKSRITDRIKGKHLFVDGYNVLFTLLNYRLGRNVFISIDNILRDAGSLHGKLRDERIFLECIDQLLKHLFENLPASVQFYIDSPVSSSEKHCRLLNDKLLKSGINGKCDIVKSADHLLKQTSNGLLATSDTIIIDQTTVAITDIPNQLLGKKPGIIDLNLFRLDN